MSAATLETARRWTEDTPRGWLQVEAVVARLRQEFVHDHHAVVPGDCQDAVTHFLHVGRGPDYLFATTAAMLLRSLGYPTRLVTGFYARPERFDRQAGQTAVLKEDLHVWAEVGIDGRHWIAIEPTPGYEPPRESLTWRQRAAQIVRAAVRSLEQHWLAILAAFLAGVIAVWQRRSLGRCPAVGLLVGRGTRFGGPARDLDLHLLEWRAWLAGRSRPAHATLARWYAPLLAPANDSGPASVRAFFDSAERTLYLPLGTHRASPQCDQREVRRACRVLASRYNAGRLRAILERNAVSAAPCRYGARHNNTQSALSVN